MTLNSHNEWDKLREVIVGCNGVSAPLIWPRPGLVDPKILAKAQELARKAFPDWLVNEIDEDQENLIRILEDYGATVLRPDPSFADGWYTTPFWSASGEPVWNARDLYLVVGDTLIESPSQERHRFWEAAAYYNVWYEYFKDGGFKWVSGPRPLLRDGYMETFNDPAALREDGNKLIKLKEREILFEAANTVRIGQDLLFLISRSGNRMAAKWLQGVLSQEYRVHTSDEIYRSSHIDSTVLALRPGLVLLNANRVSEKTCPDFLKKWNCVYFDEIVPAPQREREFHEQVRIPINQELDQLGFESTLGGLSSDWIGMNFLSLDENTVVIDERQEPLIKLLNRYGIDCIPMSYRHSYITGGIHCNSLDTVRDSKLESYF